MPDIEKFSDETPAERLARLQAEMRAAAHAAQAIGESDGRPSTALVPTNGNIPAVQVKAEMAAHRANLIHAQAEVKAAADKVKEEVDAQTRHMQDMMRNALAELEPLRQRVQQMEEGIWTVNLYLGRDEEIQPLIDGEPAPAGTPLHIRQTVLFMDEEVAALAEDGGMDFSNIDLFDDWLLDPAHRDLLIPEAKGVVAVKPRRTDVDYGNPWESASKNAANKVTYFVIRNGEKLFRMSTDFEVGSRLVPNRNEFTSMFREAVNNRATGKVDVVDLEPGSDAWLKAEKSASARERHFMRIALILQGLIDRTTVFHPIGEGLSLLHPEAYNDGTVVLIADEEMALTTSREPYRKWVARLNRDLRPGMRIIGSFNAKQFTGMRSHDRDYRDQHDRLTPATAENPESLVIHYLDGRRDGGFVFKYKRTQERYIGDSWGSGGEFRVPKTRASCVIYPDDTFIIPLDLVTIEEMETYLNARTERHAYISMMPLLQAAIAVKKAEAAAEAPFRDLIARQIATAHNLDPATLTADVLSLVDWWKLSNTIHRPLVASDATGTTDEAKALRMIVAEWVRRQKDTASTDEAAEAKAVAHLREAYPDTMYVGRARDGKIVAFVPQPSKYPVQVTGKAVYVTEVKIGITLRGKASIREWVLPGNRATRMRTLFENDTWAGWNRSAHGRRHLTDDQINTLAEDVAASALARITDDKHDRSGHLTEGRPADILAITLDPKSSEFGVILHPTVLPFTDITPLSPTTFYSAQYYEIKYKWSYEGGNLTAKRSSLDRVPAWSNDPFEKGHPLEVPWHTDGHRYSRPGLIFFDQQVFDAAMEAREIIKTRNTANDELRDLVNTAAGSIKAEWLRRAEADRYARFIEDYADPSLWEGHQKTLAPLNYPYEIPHKRHTRGDFFFRENLWTLTALLVEAGVNVNGMTVTEAARLAQAEHGATQWAVPEEIADYTLSTDKDTP